MRHAAVSSVCFAVAISMCVACGAPQTESAPGSFASSGASGEPLVVEGAGGDTAVAASSSPRPSGPLTREEAERLVARGLGPFLARIEVSPVLAAGRFVGFRLDRATDLADWQAAGADIRLGDVIVRVNGVRIERPEQGLWAFEQLRIVRAIDVELVRQGSPLRLHSPIVERVAARASSPPPSSRE
ncbi:MAG: hypothetical protein WCJ30_27110 [Deltaproteobacteria bacterium]